MDSRVLGDLFILANGALYAGQSILSKYYQRSVRNNLLTSLLFTALIGLCNGVIFLVVSLIQGFVFSPASLAYIIPVGALLVALQAIMVIAFRLGNVSVYCQISALGGIMLPFLYGILFFRESASVFKIIGVCLMGASLFMPLLDNLGKAKKSENHTKGQTILFYVLCFLAFSINGTIIVINTIHTKADLGTSTSTYTSLYSFAMCITGAVGYSIVRIFKRNNVEDKASVKGVFRIKPLLLIFGFALCYSLGSLTGLEGVKYVDSSLFFPIACGFTVVFTYFPSLVLFKEPIKKFSLIGVIVTAASIVLFLF